MRYWVFLSLCVALGACGDHKTYPNDTLACKNYRSQLTGPTPPSTVVRLKARCLASRQQAQAVAGQP